MIKKILDFLVSLFTYKEKKAISSKTEQVVEEPALEEITEEDVKTNLESEIQTKEETPIIEQEEVKQVAEKQKTTSKEAYKMLSVKERQTYLKTIGLYTKSIDGKVGSGTKKAYKQFNIIFLNKNSETYYEDTDKILRKIYASYKKSKYMDDSDWQYFNRFKKSEYKCKCGGKYCDGYPSKIAMRLVMTDQYIRNYYGKSTSVVSGLRCKQHNKNEGGVSNSKHLSGLASDTKTSGKKSSEVRKMISSTASTKLPFIRYSYDVSSASIHKDVNK